MTVDSDLIKERIAYLSSYLEILNGLRSESKDRFISDPRLYGSAERFIHLAIESTIDIGNHLVGSLGFRPPESYADIFEVLAENSLLKGQLVERLKAMARFRNLLVHAISKSIEIEFGRY